jgi:membrane-bound serine protease (ClpP class)
VSVAGVALLLLAFAFFAAEPFVMTHGALAVAGGVLFVLGSLILFDPAGPLFHVSVVVVVAIAVTLTVLLGFALSRVVRARRLPAETGAGRLVGEQGEVRRDGYVFVAGELWRGRSADGEMLDPGTQVTVEEVEDDLELVVRSHHPIGRTSP